MSAATNSISLAPATSVAWAEVVLDVRDGALATARALVTLAGSAALLVGAIVVANHDVRSALLSALPFPVGVVSAPMEELAEIASEPATAPAAVPAAADPRQKHVVQYLARRYRVAEEATRMLVSTAFKIGHENKLDPLLILSVVAIESSLNPFAESSMGAQGLMQVMTRVHAERFEAHGGQIAALDPVANMKVGSAILSDLISRGGSVERGLQLYVGAGNLPDDGGYGARVLSERSRLALAASGKVEAAISAGRTTVVSEQKPATADATLPAQPEARPAVESPLPVEEAAPARSA
ncbi:MAG TPA: lytic transglycosylase domain-containing protein [Burkholderiaceae bacterium]|nr:lytic transglycosylase domain-containing protein [Burkholderiaceae bacterium]